jgi:hypothetical protein
MNSARTRRRPGGSYHGGEVMVRRGRLYVMLAVMAGVCVGLVATVRGAEQAAMRGETSYAPVAVTEGFAATMARMSRAKDEVMRRQADLLAERYDLRYRAARGVTMSGGKSVQAGVRSCPGA